MLFQKFLNLNFLKKKKIVILKNPKISHKGQNEQKLEFLNENNIKMTYFLISRAVNWLGFWPSGHIQINLVELSLIQKWRE